MTKRTTMVAAVAAGTLAVSGAVASAAPPEDSTPDRPVTVEDMWDLHEQMPAAHQQAMDGDGLDHLGDLEGHLDAMDGLHPEHGEGHMAMHEAMTEGGAHGSMHW